MAKINFRKRLNNLNILHSFKIWLCNTVLPFTALIVLSFTVFLIGTTANATDFITSRKHLHKKSNFHTNHNRSHFQRRKFLISPHRLRILKNRYNTYRYNAYSPRSYYGGLHSQYFGKFFHRNRSHSFRKNHFRSNRGYGRIHSKQSRHRLRKY